MTTFDAPTLVGMRRVESVTPSPDATWLAVAVQRLDHENRSKYVTDLWRVPLGGGEPTPLTRGKWNDRAPAFRSDGALLFLSNRPTGAKDDDGHDKRSQVFAFLVTGGEPVCLTDEPLGVAAFQTAVHADVMCVQVPLLPEVPYAEQRKAVKERGENGPTALTYDEMPVRFWDHWLPPQVDHLVTYVDGARARDLTPNAGPEMRRSDWRLSPDGRVVAFHGTHTSDDRLANQTAELIDVGTGERRELLSADRTWIGNPVFSPDGARIAMSRHTRRDGEFGAPTLIVVDAASGVETEVEISMDEGLAPVAWSPDGRRIVLSGPLATHRPVFTVDVASGELARITAVTAGGTHLGVAICGDGIVGVRSSVVQPPEVFQCALSPGAEPTVLTNLSGFEGAGFAKVENHTVVSTDGASVQYRVVRPAQSSGPLPCIMAIHGGPIADWGDIWHWRWNSLVLAAAGFVVALPNPRGSVGFGQEFIEGIWNNSWGGQCYEDLMAVADALCERDDVDASRVVAMGGSFGGYMTNWIGTQTDRFRCLVTHASIFDMTAFHGVTDMPAWWAFSFGVAPYADRKAFDRYSPVAHVENWKSPTLVIHGDRDYRVPIGESLSLFEALKVHDVDARLLVFPDENHWILRPKNVEAWYANVLDFIGTHTG